MTGGFIAAILAGLIYFKLKNLPFLAFADAMAPNIGIALTLIGCFLNGCCFGIPWDGPFSVPFPPLPGWPGFQHLSQASGLHPSQLYLALGGLAITTAVLLMERFKKPFQGFLFYITGLLYGGMRFVVDFSRYYEPSERFGVLNHNQIVCIGLILGFVSLIVYRMKAVAGDRRFSRDSLRRNSIFGSVKKVENRKNKQSTHGGHDVFSQKNAVYCADLLLGRKVCRMRVGS